MKLKNSIGNRRIVEIAKGIEGILAHEELAVKHDITIHNLKYLLRKMVDMGIIEITRERNLQGQLGGSYCHVLEMPEIDIESK